MKTCWLCDAAVSFCAHWTGSRGCGTRGHCLRAPCIAHTLCTSKNHLNARIFRRRCPDIVIVIQHLLEHSKIFEAVNLQCVGVQTVIQRKPLLANLASGAVAFKHARHYN